MWSGMVCGNSFLDYESLIFGVDPGQVTTEDGYLKITVEKVRNHGLNYRSGMLSTWNKFCFTGGLIEGTSLL